MKLLFEIAGLAGPLMGGALFAVAGFIAPFGDAAHLSDDLLSMAAVLLSLTFAVGVHLLVAKRKSAILGVLCGIAAGAIVTSTFAEVDRFGDTAYWQVMSVIMLSVTACGWHFRSSPVQTGQLL